MDAAHERLARDLWETCFYEKARGSDERATYKHAAAEPQPGYYTFSAFALYQRPELACRVVDALIHNASALLSDIDLLLPLPSSGLPLAGWLQAKLRKPVMAWSTHERQLAFPLDSSMHPLASKRILTVDFNLNTGGSYALAYEALSRLAPGVSQPQLLAVLDNDEPAGRTDVATQLHTQGLCWSLFKVSEIWRLVSSPTIANPGA
jgi:hypothetical protein